jgi:hypothetical protein
MVMDGENGSALSCYFLQLFVMDLGSYAVISRATHSLSKTEMLLRKVGEPGGDLSTPNSLCNFGRSRLMANGDLTSYPPVGLLHYMLLKGEVQDAERV